MIAFYYLKIHKLGVKKLCLVKYMFIPYFNFTHLKQLHIKTKIITAVYNNNTLLLNSSKKSILVCLPSNFPRNLTHSNSKKILSCF